MSEWKSVPEYGSKGTLLVDDTQVEYATISHLQDLGYAVVPMHGLDSIVSLNTVPLRDRLAMAALTGLVAACADEQVTAALDAKAEEQRVETEAVISNTAYAIADAMLAARSAKGDA